MSFDFSNEEEQREFRPGPVPGGSIVILRMSILEPAQQAQDRDNRHIYVSKNGLRQIYCQFVVDRGAYEGVQFRQNITLPLGQQKINLTEGQRKSCIIGGAQLKAICLASGHSPTLRDITDMEGWKFPARLGINDRPTEKDGKTYWNNIISRIVTPKDTLYEQVRRDGEIIAENGPLTGKGAASNHPAPHSDMDALGDAVFDSMPQNDGDNYDDCPF